MNYIKRLECELNEARTELTGLKIGINDLRSYLHSSKFHIDTTVQVDDVTRRLQDAFDLSDRLLREQQEITSNRMNS